jgi:hypothetical protein
VRAARGSRSASVLIRSGRSGRVDARPILALAPVAQSRAQGMDCAYAWRCQRGYAKRNNDRGHGVICCFRSGARCAPAQCFTQCFILFSPRCRQHARVTQEIFASAAGGIVEKTVVRVGGGHDALAPKGDCNFHDCREVLGHMLPKQTLGAQID